MLLVHVDYDTVCGRETFTALSGLKKKCVTKGPGLFCSNPYAWLARESGSSACYLTTRLFRSLLSLLVPFQSLLSWSRRGCGGTGNNDVFRGEESGARLSSTGWVAVKSAVVSAAAFCLPF